MAENGIRTPNVPNAPLVEVLGHYDAGGGQRALGRSSLSALVDALRGIISTDPTGIASLRAALDELDTQVRDGLTQEGTARQNGLLAAAQALEQVRKNLSDGLTQEGRGRVVADAETLRQALDAVTSEANARVQLAELLTRLVNAEADNRSDSDTDILRQMVEGDEVSLEAVDDLRRDVVTGVVARLRSGRPGDNPIGFTLSNAIGGASDLLRLPPKYLADSDLGAVARFSEPATLSTRDAFPVEAGRVVRVRASVRRFADSPDPANEGVVIRVLWLDQSKSPLSLGNRFTEISRLTTLRASDGPVTLTATVANAAGENVTMVAPYGARYGRLQAQLFGSTHTTDVVMLEADDITAAQVLPAASADLQAQVAALVAQGLPARLDSIEARTDSPLTVTFKTLTDARAASIDPSFQAVNLLGLASPADGGGRLFRRFPGGTPPAEGTWFQSADGAYWKATAAWIGAPDLDLSTAAPAVHGVGIAVADGLNLSTWGGLFNDLAVYPHRYLPFGVTFEAATLEQKQVAMEKAVAQARGYWNLSGRIVAIVVVRTWDLIREINLDIPCQLIPVAPNISIICRAKMRSGFNITVGRIFVGGFTAVNAANPFTQTFDYSNPAAMLEGAAAAAFRVEKPYDFYRVTLRGLRLESFPYGIDFINGTCVHFEEIYGLLCGLLIRSRNGLINSRIANVENQYGSCLLVDRNPNQPGQAGSGGPNGPEGVTYDDCRNAQTSAPAFGCKFPGIYGRSGLGMGFIRPQPQQHCYSAPMQFDGSADQPVETTSIVDIYADTSANPQAVFDGVVFNGACSGMTLRGGKITYMLGFGVSLNGTSALGQEGMNVVEVSFIGNEKGDLYANYASASVRDNRFRSPVGIFETNTCRISGDGNEFYAFPQSLSRLSNWTHSRGPGAPLGLPVYAGPAAAQAATLGLSMEWLDSSVSPAALRRMGI